jgi:Ca2+-binding RTX toxin-like protein
VNLSIIGPQATGGSGSDTLAAIENLTGSAFGDLLTGNGGDNLLSGAAGNDVLDGGAGADTIDGGEGTDAASYLSAAAGVTVSLAVAGPQNTLGAGIDTLVKIEDLMGSTFGDVLSGNSGTNSLWGGGGDDILDGGAGTDRLDGGGGVDTAVYGNATSGVTASLVTGLATGGGGSDTFVGIENLTGSAFGDNLAGDAAANVLRGGGGADVLTGGAGADDLFGGAGADRFIVSLLGDSAVGARDSIRDFNHADGDRIDLSLIDAIVGLKDNAFTLTGGFTHVAGQLISVWDTNHYVVQGDVNGDGVADFAINVFSTTVLVSADFLL